MPVFEAEKCFSAPQTAAFVQKNVAEFAIRGKISIFAN